MGRGLSRKPLSLSLVVLTRGALKQPARASPCQQRVSSMVSREGPWLCYCQWTVSRGGIKPLRARAPLAALLWQTEGSKTIGLERQETRRMNLREARCVAKDRPSGREGEEPSMSQCNKKRLSLPIKRHKTLKRIKE